MENAVDLIVLTGEDGEEFEVEIIGRVEVNAQEYYIVRPTEESEVYTALRVDVDENNTEVFTTVEDDEELNLVEEAYNLAMFDEDEN